VTKLHRYVDLGLSLQWPPEWGWEGQWSINKGRPVPDEWSRCDLTVDLGPLMIEVAAGKTRRDWEDS
jgi:hypothetical protein